ncbi:MAG: glycoside hydrolase family 16 protein [Treponema sp.]|nr:glycoside hydrolase family 16 protein [Treponema sp.]
MKKMMSACLTGIILVSCATEGTRNLNQIISPQVFPINAPAAGNYPQGLFKYPYKAMSLTKELFTQTIEWTPAVSKTFAAGTQYTAALKLNPVNGYTFEGTTLADINGLPTDGVEDISLEINGRNLVIRIAFKSTANENADPQIIFSDEFEGTALDRSKWDLCPEWDRQGRSSWRDDMVSVGGGSLHLKFRRDAALGRSKSSNSRIANNWIRSGAIRTRSKNGQIIFENGYGYYEARIQFPVVEGTWGAFWLMTETQALVGDEGVDGTEIDIVESIHNQTGQYNAAMHWNGYGDRHKSAGSGGSGKPVAVYDGKFHVFALDWSPSEYVFYVDGIEFWRSDGGPHYNNSGINQNQNYIKLSVEGADWAGTLPTGFSEAEMLIDYVRVYNQPKIQ